MNGHQKRRLTYNAKRTESLDRAMDRLKEQLDTDNTSEVIRRSVLILDRLMAAERVEVTEGGVRQQVLMH